MSSLFTSASAAALLTLAWLPAAAAPLFGGDELRSNGAVSRHHWSPDFARGEVGGVQVSAGLALGLRRSFRAQLDTSIAPGLRFELGRRTSMTLLGSGSRGAMLVWQRSN